MSGAHRAPPRPPRPTPPRRRTASYFGKVLVEIGRQQRALQPAAALPPRTTAGRPTLTVVSEGAVIFTDEDTTP